MAEVVKVPIVGNVKTPYVYAAGAAVLGIAGYAWMTRRPVEEEGFAVELPVDEYAPPNIVDSGISVGGQAVGEPIARTNVEWRNMAQAEGEALGFTQAVMQSALTKYLGKGRLNATEAAAMAAVVAILGQPPTGGPYNILLEPFTPPPTQPPPTEPPPTQPPPTQPPPSAPPPPPAPSVPTTVGPIGLLPLGAGHYAVAIPPTPGATQYRLRWETSNEASGWAPAHAGGQEYLWLFGYPEIQCAVRVQAANAAGWDPHGAGSNIVYSRG
jgi:hypothetical protein